MKIEKNKVKNKKTKAHNISKKLCIILIAIICIVVCFTVMLLKYINSDRYQKKKLEKTVSKWAKEYYIEKLVSVAAPYIEEKAGKGENITINLDALKKYGKNTDLVKNVKTGRKCNDIDSYVSIKIPSNSKDIKKDYKIEKVVLDCFK